MPARRSIARLMSTGVMFLVGSLVVIGCGSVGQGGGQQQQEQASEESTQEEELAPVTKVQADRMYAGRVAGTDALIGVAVREQTNELVAYVCDGPPQTAEAATIEAWFRGPIEGNEVALTADGGDEQLLGNLNPAGSITGTFTDAYGQTYDFRAEPVDPAGEGGLYWTQPVEGEGLSSRGGTILLDDGEERGKRLTRPRPTGK